MTHETKKDMATKKGNIICNIHLNFQDSSEGTGCTWIKTDIL